MAEDDLIYLLRRATQERALAATTEPPSARAAHQALAEAYDRRAREHSTDRLDGVA